MTETNVKLTVQCFQAFLRPLYSEQTVPLVYNEPSPSDTFRIDSLFHSNQLYSHMKNSPDERCPLVGEANEG